MFVGLSHDNITGVDYHWHALESCYKNAPLSLEVGDISGRGWLKGWRGDRTLLSEVCNENDVE